MGKKNKTDVENKRKEGKRRRGKEEDGKVGMHEAKRRARRERERERGRKREREKEREREREREEQKNQWERGCLESTSRALPLAWACAMAASS